MNIEEAKEEIIRSVRAYTAKDAYGCSRIPVPKQRPLLLIGPPGVGKTAVMEQAADACGVGLLAYTMTHHTRQSAVGLPQLVEQEYEGKKYTVTEYTMSEIIGEIYAYMKRTGHREGILFLDEINCVSETLAPTMLQLLQYKTFGNHRVPEGWIIAAAGNPKEFNRSVRDLDMASLDRVRVIQVEADFGVWKDYAWKKGVHPAVLSYLETHPEHFYRVNQEHGKREFVTARGWEDLSVVLTEYERQGMETGRDFMAGFLRCPEIAGDFASYYQMYCSMTGKYRIAELADGRLEAAETDALKASLQNVPADARCVFIRHLLAAAGAQMTEYGRRRRYLSRRQEVLEQYRSRQGDGQDAEDFLRQRAHALKVRKENGLLKPGEEGLERRVDDSLREILYGPGDDSDIGKETEDLKRQKEEILKNLNRLTDFVRDAFGEDLELAEWLRGIENHGDAHALGFSRPEYAVLLDRKGQEAALKEKIKTLEEQYETADCI